MRFFRRSNVTATPASAPEGWNPLTLAWLASLWLASLANWPLWFTLGDLPEMASLRGRVFMRPSAAW